MHSISEYKVRYIYIYIYIYILVKLQAIRLGDDNVRAYSKLCHEKVITGRLVFFIVNDAGIVLLQAALNFGSMELNELYYSTSIDSIDVDQEGLIEKI